MSNLPPGFQPTLKRRGNATAPDAPAVRISTGRFNMNEVMFESMGRPAYMVVAFNPETRQVAFSPQSQKSGDAFAVASNGPVESARTFNVSAQRLLNAAKAPFKSNWVLTTQRDGWWITSAGIPVSDEREKAHEAARAAKRAQAAANGQKDPGHHPAPELEPAWEQF